MYVNTTSLLRGEHCTYIVEATCGGPSFKVMNNTATPANNYGIIFMEYNAQRYKFFKDVPKTLKKGDAGWNFNYKPNITLRYNETYSKGMPARNQTFEDVGQQGLYSAQMKPRRLLSNGLFTLPTKLGEKSDSSYDPKVDQGYAQSGYGTPTEGEYTTWKLGWKTFGSVG